MKTLEKIILEIDRRLVLPLLGYRAASLPLPLESLLTSTLRKARGFLKPQGIYEIYPLQEVKAEGKVVFGEGFTFFSPGIARMLSSAEALALFIVTVGPYLEDEAAELAQKGEITQSLFLEAAGSAAAESLAQKMQEDIEEEARRHGWLATLRYSPGYCDWDLTQQRVLFSALAGEVIGVTLNPQCIMVPRKSISALIGLGAKVERYFSLCRDCTVEGCRARR